jgi:tetratricopeptide (TPR) repeat protein
VDPKKAKQQKEDYELAMGAGRDAMKKLNYQGAINAFTEALNKMPGDKAATDFLNDARAGLARQQAEFTRLMTAGQTALAARKYTDAAKAYGDALKLFPNDPGARKGLADAQAGPKAPPMPLANPQAEYAKQMQAAAALEKQKKWEEAVKAYQEALKWLPRDAKASAALKNAQFQLHVDKAQKAAAAKRFPEAVKEYEEALKLFPNDAAAKSALQRAKQGKP